MNKIWIVVIVVVVLLLAVGGVAGHQATTTDAFCSSCHAYERASWDHGMHPHVGCLECHTGGFVRDKTQGARKVFLVFTGQVDPHHDELASYPDKTMKNCEGCHMTDEVAEHHPHFRTRHTEYTQAAEFCIACHEAGHVEQIRNQRYLNVRRDGQQVRGAPR
ncbi:MAG: NapC/NirT family cytochrome c [Gammaproteobacteria bacterium]